MNNTVIILLAGSSTRFGEATPKQFVLVKNKPLIYYTIKSFEDSSDVDQIVLVTKQENIEGVKSLVSCFGFTKVIDIVKGGETRQESAYNGLKSLENKLEKTDGVLIHDGARPLVSSRVIHELFEALHTYQGATTALPSENTITMVDKSSLEIVGTLNRDEIYQIQTPQAFIYGTILSAHEYYKGKNLTDDSQMLLGVTPVKIVLGDKKSFKITTKDDLKLLELFLGE